MLFQKLRVWHDTVPRTGPENMAVDEALTRNTSDGPILRIYRWEENWASFGYFQKFEDARAHFPENVRLIRRWTAGGFVDHRNDVTYTLAIPAAHQSAMLRGGKIYCEIHRALVSALQQEGISCELAEADSENQSKACFQKPVRWDVISKDGKIAGAGQRRGRWGVLHQGSVQAGTLKCLSEALSSHPIVWDGLETVNSALTEKYEGESWMRKI